MWRQPLIVHLSVLFSILLVVACGTIGWHDYYQARRIALIAAEDVSRPVMRGVGNEVERLFGSVSQLANLLAASQVVTAKGEYERIMSLPLVTRALEANPDVSAVYVGHDDGSFFYVVALRAGIPAPVPLPTGTAYAVRYVAPHSDGDAAERWSFYDANLESVGSPITGTTSYDPRKRPWFLPAAGGEKPVMTEPYIFDATSEPGATAARRNEMAGAVVGVDVRLARLGEILAGQRLTPGSDLALVDARRRVIATSRSVALPAARGLAAPTLPSLEESGVPILAMIRGLLEADRKETLSDVEVGERLWKVGRHVAQIDGGQTIDVIAAIPTDELLTAINAVRREAIWITAAIAAIAVPIVFMLSLVAAQRLRRLEAGARAVRALRFDTDFGERSHISEIDELGRSLGSMQETIRRFLEIGRALMEERSMDRMFARMLSETVAAAHAVQGVLLLADPQDHHLTAARAADAAGTQDGIPERLPKLLAEMDQATHPIARAIAEKRTTVARADACEQTAALLETLDTDGTLISVPLFDRDGELLGVVCLALAAATPVSAEMLNFVEALCGSSSVAIENGRLVQGQKDLLEAFIRLVASAIDAKSAYTGGHCQRVPELTLSIAAAASASEAPAFTNYRLDEQLTEELRLAAWLHDCGKVTTPEWVVDKATRLECVSNRIHEVRTRFEVLWRDAEIAALRETLLDPARAGVAAETLAATQARLRDDFAFVASCNLGNTFMSPERLERLNEIAGRTWLRQFDDRLGLTKDELTREPAEPPALPAEEPLLADKPRHKVPQPGVVPDYLGAGFRAAAPVHAFDQGEVYNLSIRRGTLTDEERFKINEHVMQTILMLRRLPLPAGLRDVPLIAGAHHEQLSGNGYPSGLKGEHLSISQRILAVADVFEALTAADRPYKTAKSVDEALNIMRSMAKDGHLDADVIDLLSTSGVAAAYGTRWGQARPAPDTVAA